MTEREQFESVMRGRGEDYLYRRDVPGCERIGEYCRQGVQDQWEIWQASRRAALEEAAQLCAKRSERAGTMGRAIEAIDLALAIRALTGDTNNG